MRCFAFLVLLNCCALAGCTTLGGLDRLSLPEDPFATTQRLERIVPHGMPVEDARQLLERYGFRCRYEETVGVPYLYGVQVKERHVWPFQGTWSTTVYHRYGLVTGVRGHSDPAVVERGITIPPHRLARFPAKSPKPGGKDAPAMVRKDAKPKTSSRKKPAHGPREESPHR